MNQDFDLGMLARDLGKLEVAILNFQKAIGSDPKFVRGYNELGMCLRDLGRFEEAEKIFRQAISLDPGIPQLYNNLGNVLGDLGKLKEEMECYQKALSINPQYPQALGNLGASHKLRGEIPQARACYLKAIEFDPSIGEFYLNLGMIEQDEGRIEEAKMMYESAVKLSPDSPVVVNALYSLKRRICDWEGLGKLEEKMDDLGHEDPFTSVLRHEDLKKNFQVAVEWSKKIEKRVKLLPKRTGGPGKIRLGYLSSDFRDHPIGQMVSGMFKHHDRSRFEVFAYSYGGDDESEFNKWVHTGVDHFVDITNMENGKAATRIADDNIDILIDLTGYTRDNRLEIAAYRPARVQVTWLGFPGTSGARFFDYMIVDHTVVLSEHEKFYSEKLLYLPHSYQINNDLIGPSTIKYSRRECGLETGKFVMASFNQAYKIEPVMWEIWMRLLKRIPESVLWLWEQDQMTTRNLQREASARGVDPTRLVFAGRLSKREHLSRLRLADIGLDTRIYGGHTTTSDMLRAGVPVVTRIGNHFASRVCAGILNEVGLNETVVGDLNSYEKIVVELARNPVKLKELKARLTKNRLDKTLYNTKRFVRSLEDIYVHIGN